ncbi:vanZ like family protein [bacterium BMS3Abin04]|nr:vanZ like family protein [bacterium BMS3Abin04]
MYRILKKNKIFLVYVPLTLYWILLFIATSIPSPALPDLLDFSDKIKHFIAYFGFSILLTFALHFQKKSRVFTKYFAVAAIIFIMFYGALDELHQLFIPNRMCEFWDWTADAVGGYLGVLITFLYIKSQAVKRLTKQN